MKTPPKKPKKRVPRTKHALRFVEKAVRETDPNRRDQFRLMGEIAYVFGNLVERDGHHRHRPKGSTQYQDADKLALNWIKQEFERTGERSFRRLAIQCISTEVIPDSARKFSTVESVIRRWRRAWEKEYGPWRDQFGTGTTDT